MVEAFTHTGYHDLEELAHRAVRRAAIAGPGLMVALTQIRC